MEGGRGPGGGLRAAREGGAPTGRTWRLRRAPGSSWVGELCPGPGPSPCPRFLSLCPSVGPRRRRLLGSWAPGLRGGAPGAARGPRRGAGGQGPHPHGPGRVPDGPVAPQSPFPTPPVPGPRQASVGKRQRLTMRSSGKAPMLQRRPASPAANFSMAWASPGPPSRGPDGQSRAARASAPAATSWGRRGAPRLAARPVLRASRGRPPSGAPAPAPRPSPHPPARARSRRQGPPPRRPGSPAPSPSVQVTAGDRDPRRAPGGKTWTRSGIPGVGGGGRPPLPRRACSDPPFLARWCPGLRESPPVPLGGPASLPKASAAAIPAAVAAFRTYITSSFTHPGEAA